LSAALQLPFVWAGYSDAKAPRLLASAVRHIRRQRPPVTQAADLAAHPAEEISVSYAFYRKHTEKLLRRYFYASTQIGRTPNLLGDPVDRGWASSRRVRTFEDALIFVLDVERCLKRLSRADLHLISRVVLQEFTHAETAALLGISVRTVSSRFPKAIDQLTEILVEADLLILPD
jgi:DNA-directed RNA polymerase specialized sigma24 family protein